MPWFDGCREGAATEVSTRLVSGTAPHAAGGCVEDLTGAVVEGFRLLGPLGRGAMGTVYLAEHVAREERIAVKVMHPAWADDPVLTRRFEAEARAGALVDDPRVVKVRGVGRLEGGRPALLLDLLEGRPLEALGHPLRAAVALPLLVEACGALAVLHAAGVVHRDVKPDNLFLVRRPSGDEQLVLIDLGVAQLSVADEPEGAFAPSVLGTPAFMAPEQWKPARVDARADVYSLGVTAYLLLTGKLPFGERNVHQMCQAHQQQTPLAPHRVHPLVPECVSRVVMRSLAKNPAERYPTADVLGLAFRRALLELAAGARTAPAPRLDVGAKAA